MRKKDPPRHSANQLVQSLLSTPELNPLHHNKFPAFFGVNYKHVFMKKKMSSQYHFNRLSYFYRTTVLYPYEIFLIRDWFT